jgi:hypothetical protein
VIRMAVAPTLVWQAATREMNPTVKQRVIDEPSERDPAASIAGRARRIVSPPTYLEFMR